MDDWRLKEWRCWGRDVGNGNTGAAPHYCDDRKLQRQTHTKGHARLVVRFQEHSFTSWRPIISQEKTTCHQTMSVQGAKGDMLMYCKLWRLHVHCFPLLVLTNRVSTSFYIMYQLRKYLKVQLCRPTLFSSMAFVPSVFTGATNALRVTQYNFSPDPALSDVLDPANKTPHEKWLISSQAACLCVANNFRISSRFNIWLESLTWQGGRYKVTSADALVLICCHLEVCDASLCSLIGAESWCHVRSC